MKVTREIFLFEKRSWKVKIRKVSKLSGQSIFTGKNSGKLYIKRTDLEGIAIAYEGVEEHGRTNKHK